MNSTMTTKAILFDFWGTLVDNGVYPSPIRQAQQILRIRLPFSDYVIQFEREFMTKKFPNLSDGFTYVAQSFNIRPRDYQIENLVGLWNKNRILAKPYPETIKILEELKKDFKIALISNTDAFTVEPILEKYNLSQYFDTLVFSYNVGKLKSDPEFYPAALSALNVDKSEAVVVGDSIETDILGAEKAGIRAILVDRRNTRIYKEKVADLSELRKIL